MPPYLLHVIHLEAKRVGQMQHRKATVVVGKRQVVTFTGWRAQGTWKNLKRTSGMSWREPVPHSHPQVVLQTTVAITLLVAMPAGLLLGQEAACGARSNDAASLLVLKRRLPENAGQCICVTLHGFEGRTMHSV